MRIPIAILGWAAAALAAGSAQAATVSFAGLVRELTDLEGLARISNPAYTCKQFSSYDRNSKDPAVPTDENWFANGDRGQHLREEQRNGASEWVMMDAEGPGAIVRIWSANPKDAGILRIYLDGAADPALEMPLADLLGGKAAIAPPPIAGERSKGWNCFLPIPYAKHCKVTASERDFYYHVNYRTYAPGTDIETFSIDLAGRHAGEIQTAAATLAAPDRPLQGLPSRMPCGTLAPGAKARHTLTAAGGILRELTAHVASDNLEAALRGTVIEIDFDGKGPQVVAPLGDFFGTAPGASAFASLPCGVREDGTLYARWAMPFEREAVVTLTNRGSVPIAVDMTAQMDFFTWDAGTMHFHAKYRAARQVPTKPRIDWNYLTATGAGRFAGVMLHIANPVKEWWGEGDEKIYVDGETFPSHFGTGTEDYFGYAWCSPEPFVHAYHNQPRCDGPGNYGQTCVSRFHIVDNIPFTKSFRFDLEVWHWAETKIDQSVVAYWYALPGGSDNTPALDDAMLTVPAVPPLPEPRKVAGALEGEKLKVLAKTGGETQRQETGAHNWSREAQLWWTDPEPGDTLELEFSAPAAGRYTVVAVFTKAADYGIHQLAINGVPQGAPIDCYNNGVIATPETEIGAVDLAKGKNRLAVTCTGANPAAQPRHMFGLDYLLLKPAP